MYVVIHTDAHNVPEANARVFVSEYAACRVLDNAHAQWQPAEDREEVTIDRESDDVLRVFDLNGRQLQRYDVYQLERDR
jgi:hypothetical protein